MKEEKVINILDKRNYFREFEYEVLTSKPANKELIGEFVSKKANNSLESYIRDIDKAWTEDLDGETRVYLVKDKSSGDIALFFSCPKTCLKAQSFLGSNNRSITLSFV